MNDSRVEEAGASRSATRNRTPLASIVFFFTLLVPTAAVVVFMYTEQMAQRSQASEIMTGFLKENYKQQMEQAFEHLDLISQPLLRSFGLKNSILANNEAAIAIELKRFKQDNPAVTSVRVIPYQSVLRPTQTEPPLSFSEFELMRQLERREAPQLEFYEEGDQEHIQLGKAIIKDDKVIATVLLSVNKTSFDKFFIKIPEKFGNFRLQQHTSDKPRLWIELGYSKSEDVGPEDFETFEMYGQKWRFEYTGPPVTDLKDLSNLKDIQVLMVLKDEMPDQIIKAVYTGMSISFVLMLFQMLGNKAWRSAINRNLLILTSKVHGRTDKMGKSNYSLSGFSEAESNLKEMIYSFTRRTKRRKKKFGSSALPHESPLTEEELELDEQHDEEEDEFKSIEFTEVETPKTTVDEPPEVQEVSIVERPDFENIFREYDIRGIVNETLTDESLLLLGKAIGTLCLQEGELSIVVGRDGRLSSAGFSEALISGLVSTGCNVIDIGMAPTPLVYFGTNTLSANSGVIITGSHNPPNYNGIKVIIKGVTLYGAAIKNLFRIIKKEKFVAGSGNVTNHNIKEVYMSKICADVHLKRKIKIVVDTGNGVAGPTVKGLLTRMGCEVISLNEEIDGNFPHHHPDPSKPENLRQLINEVKSSGAELGLAFDGDGDRLGLVIPSGEIVYPDRLLMLFVKDILTKSPGKEVIFDVKCTSDLAKWVSLHNGRPTMWKTGHSLIKAKLRESNAILAGEMSGHIFFNDRWFGFDDALYCAVRLLEILASSPKSLPNLIMELPKKVSTPEILIPVAEEDKFKIVDTFINKSKFDGEVLTIDGIRVDYPNGWGLLRASNTTPNLTARFEADSHDNLDKIKNDFKKNLQAIMGSVRF